MCHIFTLETFINYDIRESNDMFFKSKSKFLLIKILNAWNSKSVFTPFLWMLVPQKDGVLYILCFEVFWCTLVHYLRERLISSYYLHRYSVNREKSDYVYVSTKPYARSELKSSLSKYAKQIREVGFKIKGYLQRWDKLCIKWPSVVESKQLWCSFITL